MANGNLILTTPESPVSAIMRAPVATVELDTPVIAIAEVLASNEIGAVAVVRHQAIVGLVSERDLIAPIANGTDLGTLTAADMMSSDLLTVGPDETVAEVAQRADAAAVRHIPVVGPSGEVEGFVSIRDLLAVLVSAV